jgi:hypothetical protein
VPSSSVEDPLDVPPAPALAALESAVQAWRRTGDATGVVQLGYGEATRAVLWEADGARYACERLPSLGDAGAHETYVLAFDRYRAALAARDVPVLPTLLRFLPGAGTGALWCVQPALGAGELLVDYCRAADAAEGARVLGALIAIAARAVDRGLGLDGRLSSWAVVQDDGDDGALCYRALSVPLVGDGLEVSLPVAGLPPALHVLARPLVGAIAGSHYEPRGVLTALCAGLLGERLPHLLPSALALVAPHLATPLTARDVQRAAAARRRARVALHALARLARRAQRLPVL